MMDACALTFKNGRAASVAWTPPSKSMLNDADQVLSLLPDAIAEAQLTSTSTPPSAAAAFAMKVKMAPALPTSHVAI